MLYKQYVNTLDGSEYKDEIDYQDRMIWMIECSNDKIDRTSKGVLTDWLGVCVVRGSSIPIPNNILFNFRTRNRIPIIFQ